MHESANRNHVFEAARRYYESEQSRIQPFVPGESYIPVTTKQVDFEDLQMLLDAALDMWLTAGRFAKDFEAALPKMFQRSLPALFVNSGSSANLLAVSSLCSPQLSAMGGAHLRPGDEVLTAAAGFPTTVNPLFQNQLKPVFVDIDSKTLNASPETLLSAITPQTRAIVLAHTLGNPWRVDIIKREFPKMMIVEDCCDALGAQVDGRSVGSYGDYATCSFYPAHHMTTGEGGAVMSANARLRKIAESVRDWGRDCWCESGKDNTCNKRFDWQLGDLPQGYDHKYTYSNIGYNLKSTDLQAAIGMSQMKKAPRFIEARRANWSYLFKGIQNSPILSRFYEPVVATENSNPSWFGFAIYAREGLRRNDVVRDLENTKRIGTRLLFGGNLTKQPAYKGLDYRIHGELKTTDRIMNDLFWIGVHPALDPNKMDYMLQSLEDIARQRAL